MSGTALTTVRVDLGPRSYDIRIGRGLIGEAGAHLLPVLRQKRVFIVSDETVAALHLEPLAATLARAEIACERFVLPPGEETKCFAELERLLDAMLERQIERRTAVLALGGGVIGDLAGFAAGIVLRGVDFIQVPTTLLAQIDSAVGGKTAIDTRQGKNLVGAFHQPRLVLTDTATLDTLPPREIRAGYAEMVKYALINDAPFLAWLEAHGAALLAGDPDHRRAAIARCCAAKASIVGADERENGDRALLNLGHTFAHALEAEVGFGAGLLHGEAVGIGLVLAFRLSAALGLAPAADARRIAAHLAANGLKTHPAEVLARPVDADALIRHMASDKKVRDGRIAFVLARGVGHAFVADDVPLERVRAVLQERPQ